VKTDELIKVLFIRNLANGLKIESKQPSGFPVVGFESSQLLVSIPPELAQVGSRLHVELELQRDFIKIAIPVRGVVTALRSDSAQPTEFFAELKISQKDDNLWHEMERTLLKVQQELTALFERMRGGS
jgi:hypothetical protein